MTAPSQDHGRASQRERRRFQTVRWGSFALLIGCLIIGFFHRFAPAALAGTLSHTFGISASTLGGLAALNLYVYTAMQIPSGVLLDRLGVRLCASAGAAIAAAGSLVFAFAPTVAIAYLGPPLMGLGASAVFVGIMKNNTVWFAPGSYGVMAGVTMLLANVGSVLASGPSAAVLRWLSWRDLFAGAGMVSLVLAVGVYLVARDLPEHAGFSPVVTLPRPHQHRSNRPKLGERSLRGDLNRVRTIRGLWPAFWAAIGTNATFYAFAGLWGIPLLTDGFGLPNSDAALYTTLGLLAYGIASFVIGLYSDRLGRRKLMGPAFSGQLLNGLFHAASCRFRYSS
jgi:sugar phosphate permease